MADLARRLNVNEAALQLVGALGFAAGSGDADMLRQLLAEGVTWSSGQSSPLHSLCEDESDFDEKDLGDRPACFRLLVEAGENIDRKDATGRTPLLCVLKSRGRTTLLKMLIEAGANVNTRYAGSAPNLPDYYPIGSTPLHTAAEWCSEEHVALLLKAGAAVNVRDRAGNTPFTHAIRNPWNKTKVRDHRIFPRVAPLLLRAGADIPAGWGGVSPYIRRVVAAGGFKKYEQAHIARITKILAPTPRLPPEMVRKIVEFWLHASYY